jgi:short-subunit dehydrogenase
MESEFPFSTGLVTGASSGLGRALAMELGRRGVRLALVARREEELASLSLQIKEKGGNAIVLPADLSDPEEAFRVVADSERALGQLDLVIANAGVGRNEYVIELPWLEIEQTFMVNTFGAIALVKAVLPSMIRRHRGYIAGISSLASYLAIPGCAHYSGSKAALSAFLASVRIETYGQGVSIVDVHPGFIRTPMTAANKECMPFLMEPEKAARLILRAIRRKRPVYNFPWQMSVCVRLFRILPLSLRDRLAFRSARRR